MALQNQMHTVRVPKRTPIEANRWHLFPKFAFPLKLRHGKCYTSSWRWQWHWQFLMQNDKTRRFERVFICTVVASTHPYYLSNKLHMADRSGAL